MASSDNSSPSALHECLSRIGRIMVQVVDQESLLRTLIEEAKQLVGCEAASIALHEPESGQLVFSIVVGEAEHAIRSWRLPVNQGIAGHVAISRQPYLCNHVLNDPKWFSEIDQQSGFSTRNVAALPMMYAQELIGVMELINTSNPRGFEPEDLEVLQVFVNQAALALRIHQLIEAKREAERLATFGVALADIGHSVKNILTRLEFPLALFDKAIQDRDWSVLEGCWPVLKRAGAEISALVKEMLSFSRPRRPELAAQDVGVILEELVDACQRESQAKGIALTLGKTSDPLIWMVDASVLRHAILNLISNSMDAMTEHGGALIEVRAEILSQNRELCITVHDDGPGIPKSIQHRVFDPFFSTKKSKGTGLGLANVKKGIEEHGGQIKLLSEPGEGTSFIICLPERRA